MRGEPSNDAVNNCDEGVKPFVSVELSLCEAAHLLVGALELVLGQLQLLLGLKQGLPKTLLYAGHGRYNRAKVIQPGLEFHEPGRELRLLVQNELYRSLLIHTLPIVTTTVTTERYPYREITLGQAPVRWQPVHASLHHIGLSCPNLARSGRAQK